ncbi:hypothetical protein [Desulfosarcina alkanivorans]|jgi:hypothetical protein
MFTVSPEVDHRTIERLFRHKVLRMLLNKGEITPDMIGAQRGRAKILFL